jgi:hypothetical protein
VLTKEQIKEFPWGQVLQIHSIGDFDIVEYISTDNGNVYYSVYVDGTDGIGYADTLDEAILTALGYKYLDCNNQFASFARKMLEMDKPVSD